MSLTFEVLQGRTRYRSRPVQGKRCLIGADPACDLRLGGDDMPPLHSVVIRDDDDEIRVECIERLPALLVNGRQIETATLHHGDVLTIGAVRLMVKLGPQGCHKAGVKTPPEALSSRAHLTAKLSESEIQELLAAEAADVQPASQLSASELSAGELIDCIEQDERFVESETEKQRLGAAALLHAVHERRKAQHRARPLAAPVVAPLSAPILSPSERPVVAPAAAPLVVTAEVSSTTPAALSAQLSQIAQALQRLSQELQRQSLKSAEREERYSTATHLLLETQQKLAQQLEAVLDQIRHVREQQMPIIPQRRASA